MSKLPKVMQPIIQTVKLFFPLSHNLSSRDSLVSAAMNFRDSVLIELRFSQVRFRKSMLLSANEKEHFPCIFFSNVSPLKV